jgi:hypothetical protein
MVAWYKDIKLKSGIVYASLAAIIVMVLLLVPYFNLGFDSDYIGLYEFASRIGGWQGCWEHLFKTVQHTVEPLNVTAHPEYGNVAFTTYYRPMGTLVYFLCYKLFGSYEFGHYFVHILFHALTAFFLCRIYSFFLQPLTAFWLSLMFAFHPSIVCSHIGLQCFLYPVYAFLSAATFVYCCFNKTEKLYLYFLSALLYILAVLSYESAIIFPFILAIYLLLFDKAQVIKKSWLFFLVTGIYIFFRFTLLGGLGSGNLVDFKSLFHSVYANWHQAIKPFFGLQGSATALVLALCVVLKGLIVLSFVWANLAQRRRMLFYAVGFFLAAWPVFYVSSSGRFFYPAIPFFCLVFYASVSVFWGRVSAKNQNFLSLASVVLFTLWGVFCARSHLANRVEYIAKRDVAFQELKARFSSIDDLRLIHLGTLQFYGNETFLMFSSITQKNRLLFNNPDMKAYHVTEARWYVKNPTNKAFDVIPVEQGYRFVTQDPENLFVMVPHHWQEGQDYAFSMGRLRVNKKLDHWQATDITFMFDEKWIESKNIKNTRFVTWDPAQWKFVDLATNHLSSEMA